MTNSIGKNKSLQHLELLCKVPLFSGLKDQDLKNLLKSSRISNYKKGKNIFFKEDKALNLYVVLKGLVKLSIIDLEGKETIIKIADCGTILNGIFDDEFLTDAQVVDSAIILCISLPYIRESAATNPAPISAMLLEVNKYNRELISILSQVKLADVKHKLGQFLLGMAFGGDGKKLDQVSLKCGKSLIASYLGMKPETFSRSLKKLKDDGEIEIKGSTITLLHKDALCNYCNNEISQKCSRKNSCDNF